MFYCERILNILTIPKIINHTAIGEVDYKKDSKRREGRKQIKT